MRGVHEPYPCELTVWAACLTARSLTGSAVASPGSLREKILTLISHPMESVWAQ